MRKLFPDAELNKDSVIKEILITTDDGKFVQRFPRLHPAEWGSSMGSDPMDAHRTPNFSYLEGTDPSEVTTTIERLPARLAKGTVRISLGSENTVEDVKRITSAFI